MGLRSSVLGSLRSAVLSPRVRRSTVHGRVATGFLLLATLVAGAGCQREASRDAAALTPTPAPAAEASGPRIYVSNETEGTVDVLDPVARTVLTRIPVGKRPRGLKLSKDGTTLYVALSGSPISPPGVDESTLPPPDRAADGIGVVDVASGRLERTYPSGQDPESFDLSPDGRRLYVSNEETAEMSVLDLESGEIIRRVPVGEEPEGVTVSPDGRTVWVTCEADNTVVAVDTNSFEVLARVETASRPRVIVFTRDGATMFVTGEFGQAVSVVDPAAREVVATIGLGDAVGDALPPRPMGAVLSPNGERLYVANGRGQTLSVIDVANRTVVQTIADVGERPWGVDINAEGTEVYTANGPGADVSVVDVTAGRVAGRIATGGSPWGLVVPPAAR